LDVPVAVEEDGNTLLNGDCAVIGRLEEKARIRSKKVLENEDEDEDMMFSRPEAPRAHAVVCRSK
jgi:hypothetical protein